MAGFSTGLLGFQQSADDYYKNLANDAMMQGQQAENERQYAQIADSLPMYDPSALDYARRIVAAKTAYDQAAGNAAEQARQHEIADGVRNLAKQYGVDLSQFDGSNVNTNQAANNLSMMEEKARRDYMNQETPDEFFTRRSNELMRGGLNEERAQAQAAREYQEYRAKYLHAGKNLFYDQGTKDNAINNAGAYALASLLEGGNPQTAQLFASLYAHPVDNYNLDAWTQKELTTADLANRQSILLNELGMQAANNNFNNQRILNNEQFARALEKIAYQNQLANENAAAKRQGQLQNIVDMVGLIKQFNPGMSDQEAFSVYVNLQQSRKNGSGNSNNTKTEKLSEAKQALKNIGNEAMNTVYNSKNRAEVDAAIANLRNKKQELAESGKITQEDIDSTDQLINQLEAMALTKWPDE